LRFECHKAQWQENCDVVDGSVPFEQVDLSGLSELEAEQQIESVATHLQASLNLSHGPIMRVALFSLTKASRLLIIIHHLAVDGVSWRILMEDIQTVYQQLSGGRQVRLPPKTTSFKRWAERLKEYAQGRESTQELSYWLNMPTVSSTLPTDFERGSNTVGSAQSVVSVLEEEETLVLLREVPAVFRTQINDALLTALLLTLQEWTAKKRVLLDLEGHGREDLFPELDVTRTVGWFTSIYPVWLELESNVSAPEALKAVKELMRAIPNRGIGHGVLCYLNPDPQVKESLRSLPQAEISFNYLGQIGDKKHHGSESMSAHESSGPWYGLRGERNYKLEINCAIEQNRLSVVWTYSENLHQRPTIEMLAKRYLDALRSIVTHCQTPASMEYTPSDFSESGLNQDELDRLMSKLDQSKDDD
jgi:non-ribosomal peptide synthase protein (TIGR01720 family)